MLWPKPKYSKSQVNKAGNILVQGESAQQQWALEVLNNWRASHGYPINTFQSTLRTKLKTIDSKSIVAQRLKRTPSIIDKLKRFPDMELARMQDIGGLRAVVDTLENVYELKTKYDPSPFIKHVLLRENDYIKVPKLDGYRSVHLVYRYQNDRAKDYNGLLIELQIRTRLQHVWATAVETMGTFLNYALKSSIGPKKWLDFFSLTGSAFAHLEGTPPVRGYETLTAEETYRKVTQVSEELKVRSQLHTLGLAVKVIEKGELGSYHLIVLDWDQKTVSIMTFEQKDLEKANEKYMETERLIAEGKKVQAVLVSAGPIDILKRAYPNYFLDTEEFLKQLLSISYFADPERFLKLGYQAPFVT